MDRHRRVGRFHVRLRAEPSRLRNNTILERQKLRNIKTEQFFLLRDDTRAHDFTELCTT